MDAFTSTTRSSSPMSNFEEDMFFNHEEEGLRSFPSTEAEFEGNNDENADISNDSLPLTSSNSTDKGVFSSSFDPSDDFPPVLVASSSGSSTSTSTNTLVADSWEQADAVVETILLSSISDTMSHDTGEGDRGTLEELAQDHRQYHRRPHPNQSHSGSLSWVCAPLDYWANCQPGGIDPSSISCSTLPSGNINHRFPQGQLGADFQQAFDNDQVLPYVLHRACGGADAAAVERSLRFDRQRSKGITPDIEEWNGHLPLDPVPDFFYQYPVLRNRRKHRIPSFVRDLEQQQQYQEALFAPSLSLDESYTNLSRSFSLDDAAASPPAPAPAAAAAGGNAARRGPPPPANSASIPPAQKDKANSNSSSSNVSDPKHGPGTIQVQQSGADRSALKELPALRDAAPAKREELFVLKLKLCSVVFTFDDPTSDKRGKDMKRQTLLELVDYVNAPAGQKIFTESAMGDLMAMISANVCRALPPATDDFDPEEDEPVLEPSWPHLQVAYEFFLRFIVSSEVNAKAAKKYVDQKFCLQLVELFDSEDPRERDYLKTILHRIYGKFMSHRSFIRRAISNVFYRFVYETERHNGIGELLEILGSIINGFAIPLKKEHLQFLVRALIPLHKPKCVALYHQQLSYCIIQYVEKDADTATHILSGFFKCWPWSCSGKQVMFLNELEEILELLGADQLAQVSDMLFTNLARCLDSDHFQVVERALFLWNNEHLVNSGCLSRLNAQAVLPIIYGPLYKNSSGHWNATVEGLAQNVLKMYMEYDLALYDKCTAAYFAEEEEAKRKMQAIQDRWKAIEKMATTATPSIAVK